MARPVPDWDTLTFAFTETDALYRSDGRRVARAVWDAGAIVPFGPLSLSPAAAVLSYGLGIFEGLKAFRREDGAIQVFRPDMNAARFARSAERLMMAPFPAAQFVDAVDRLVDANRRFVPPFGQGSFYIRPMEHAIEPKLGIGPCRLFDVTIYGSPVGAVKSGPTDGLRLRVVEQARVAPGGTGAAKAIGQLRRRRPGGGPLETTGIRRRAVSRRAPGGVGDRDERREPVRRAPNEAAS